MAKSIGYHIPWVLWTIIILVLSFWPGNRLPNIKLEWISIDTLAHFVMYSVLSFLHLFGFRFKKGNLNLSVLSLYSLVILAGILLGILIEIVQGIYIYQRHYDIADMVANSFGTIFGVFSFVWTAKKLDKLNR